MTEPAKDFWARADRDLLDRWPKDEAGAPEPAAKLDIQWELDSQADITVSFLKSCGIPAFLNGSLGKVLGGFASQGVEIWVPASRLEEAQALLDEGDEVIVPGPFWVSYPELVRMAGGVPVVVQAREENSFKLLPCEIEAAVTGRTRAIILNSPNNPNGFVYTRQELQDIGRLAVKHDFYIISDEIYKYLVYDGAEHVSIASLGDEIKARTITINGMSKAYAMTGWRIGYTASPVEVAKAMTNYQSHSTSNPNSIAQYAALAALSGPDTQLKSMVAEFDRRRRRIVELINGIPGLSCIPPKGAFYVMMNISGLFGKKLNGEAIVDSMSFTRLLLEDSKVAVVPGIGFGADSFVRLSYATNMANIEKGLSRIADFVSRLTD